MPLSRGVCSEAWPAEAWPPRLRAPAPCPADVVAEGRLLLIVANKLDALTPAQRQQALGLIRQTVEDSLPDVRCEWVGGVGRERGAFSQDGASSTLRCWRWIMEVRSWQGLHPCHVALLRMRSWHGAPLHNCPALQPMACRPPCPPHPPASHAASQLKTPPQRRANHWHVGSDWQGCRQAAARRAGHVRPVEPARAHRQTQPLDRAGARGAFSLRQRGASCASTNPQRGVRGAGGRRRRASGDPLQAADGSSQAAHPPHALSSPAVLAEGGRVPSGRRQRAEPRDLHFPGGCQLCSLGPAGWRSRAPPARLRRSKAWCGRRWHAVAAHGGQGVEVALRGHRRGKPTSAVCACPPPPSRRSRRGRPHSLCL